MSGSTNGYVPGVALAAKAVRYRGTAAAVGSVEQSPQSFVLSIAAGIGPERRHAHLLQKDSPDLPTRCLKDAAIALS